MRLVIALPLAVLLLTAGCGSGPGADAAAGTARSFFGAIENDDYQRACALLAPEAQNNLESNGDPCAKALEELDLSGGRVRSSVVWSRQAQVRLTQDTVFLSEFPTGWKLTAAGCE